jgi:hypothetical protein
LFAAFLDAHAFWERLEDKSDDNSLTVFRWVTRYRLKELMISFKGVAYEDEREWRVVATLHKQKEAIQYRNGRFGITPYVRLNLSARGQAAPAPVDS